MDSDRRENNRIAVSLEVKFDGVAQSSGTRISDISAEGCYIETMAYFEVDDIITLEIKMPTGNWLSLKGKIKFRHPNLGLGISFLELSQSELDVVSSLIEYESDE